MDDVNQEIAKNKIRKQSTFESTTISIKQKKLPALSVEKPLIPRSKSVNLTNQELTSSKNFKIRPHTKKLHSRQSISVSNLIQGRNSLTFRPDVSAQSYCAMMADDNEIVLTHHGKKVRQIASLTKLMTAFTVVNLCNTYGLKVRDYKIKIEEEAAFMEGTSANLRKGDELKIIDLLYGLLLPSGNDAGVALAQYFGKFFSYNLKRNPLKTIKGEEGVENFLKEKKYYDNQYGTQSIELFVYEMNLNSEKMGLTQTKFSNPTGLYNINNYSTAQDIATLTSYCLKNHLIRSIMKRKVYNCSVKNDYEGTNRQMEWRNTNKHLFEVMDCIGGKTGITPAAGPCLSSVYRVMGRELIIVLLCSYSMDHRYTDASSIYYWHKTKYS